MSKSPSIPLSKANEPASDIELLGMVLDNAEAAIQLVDAAAAPRLHAALSDLLSRLGYEIEKVRQMNG